MAKYLNNRGRIILNSMPLALCFMLLALCFILCLILYPDKANSGHYLNSAHGNTSYGVLRTSLSTVPNNYGRGNCAHCHEQHASVEGTEPEPIDGSPSKYEIFIQLFADQGDSFCYSCHKQLVGSIQISMPNQYNYSRIAGGVTTITCPENIKNAFQFVNTLGNSQLNCNSGGGSSHLLDAVSTFLTNRWGFDSVKENINPCSGCHNPHRAQKDPHTSTGRLGADGKLLSSVSRPSQHTDLKTWELWGDDNTERMNRYNYQPPCRYPWSSPCTSFEPDGFNADDASRTVDYVTFCLDCHQYDTGRTRAINWGVNGDIHGAASQNCVCDYGDKRAPYSQKVNYVLSCLDCHEPHGSPNEYLLRQEVNGETNPIFGTHKYWNFCRSCHKALKTNHIGGVPEIDYKDECWGCHGHGTTYPTEDLDKCTGCGSADIKTF